MIRHFIECIAYSVAAILLAGLIVGFIVVFGLLKVAHARDLGQWENQDPNLKKWFESLKQPDNPYMSCCGEADAYYADSYEIGPNGTYIAIITDERDDIPLKRAHVDTGTKIPVPAHKIKFDQGNPTGHGLIFLHPNTKDVWCYLPPGGV